MAHRSWLAILATVSQPAVPLAAYMKCSNIKKAYKDASCCGNPETEVDTLNLGCPYNFKKPDCSEAEPQAPRDLSDIDGQLAPGDMKPKAPTLNGEQTEFLSLTNVHFHLGAEHKSEAYKDSTDSETYDMAHQDVNRRLSGEDVRPGYMCSNDDLTEWMLAPYEFQYCKEGVEVGKTYEVHYVHSSAGSITPSEMLEAIDKGDDIVDAMSDGLGGAANGRGLLNPMVAVQAQVYHIVKNNDDEPLPDLLHGWEIESHENAVMYMGSTTGTSHTNAVCSPYTISWHVDKDCHQVTPQAFDNMCKQMKDTYGLDLDLHPHGSRMLVDRMYVVEAKYVKAYTGVASDPQRL